MKIWISYFYQVRNFESHLIPFSTAKYDPKWFHHFEDQSKIFIDNNGVVNGLRLPELVFPKDAYNYLIEKGSDCAQCVKQRAVENQLFLNESKNDWQNFGCDFMNIYFKYLWNEVNFDKLIEKFKKIIDNYKKTYNTPEEPEIVLLVHEAPSNPCAERPVLKRWFAEYGYNLEEWNPYE